MKGKTNTIYARFRHKSIDITSSIQIYIKPEHWDKKNQKIKNVIEVRNRDEINLKLAELKIYIISQFNQASIDGQSIDKKWFLTSLNYFFNRENEVSADNFHTVYLSDFAQWWIDNKSATHKVSSNKTLGERTIDMYRSALSNFQKFEKENSLKIKLSEVTSDLLDDFSKHLTETEGYAYKTTTRKLTRIKFFCARAEEENLKVNGGYKAKVFVKKENYSYKEPYLNEEEINKIFNYTSNNSELNTTRDNWIIGLWTGLRISDFLTRLDTDNIKGDFIEIKTLKTDTNVAIPLHPQVKEILKRHNGKLPKKITEQRFNRNIKIIARKIGFNEKMMGGIPKVDPVTKKKRKVVDQYYKWELMTSHICRRSFCTNLFGKVPNNVIMDVAGWSNESQMFEYNKQTNKESAIKLKEYWEKNKI